MTSDERALLARIADYLDAWARLNVALDDDQVEAGEQFAQCIASFEAARDAVSDDDVRAFRAYVERQR